MASLLFRKDRKTWELSWYVGSKRQRVNLGSISKRQAEESKRLKEYELLNPNYKPTKVPTVAQFTERYLSWHEDQHPDSHSRVKQILTQKIVPVFGSDPIHRINPENVEAWKRKAAKTLSSATVNKELRTLRALVNTAVDWNIIDKSSIRAVKELKELRSKPFNFYTVDQLTALYEATRGRFEALVQMQAGTKSEGQATPWEFVWKLMANTGLRRGEALALKWINVKDGQIQVLSTDESRTKSGRWRSIPISPGAKDALRELKKTSDKTHVLPRITPQALTRAFSKDRDSAKLTGNLHDLRHTFISHLVMQGIPLRTVQVIAGHSTVAITEKYAHLAPDHMNDAVSRLEL